MGAGEVRAGLDLIGRAMRGEVLLTPTGVVEVPPTVRHRREGRTELTERQWLAMKAIAAGYRWIDRRDGAELFLLGLAYHNAQDGFLLTRAGRELLDPWYEDMAR